MRIPGLGNLPTTRRVDLCDAGLLLGDNVYYIQAATGTVVIDAVSEGSMALGEATSFFAETLAKRPGGKRIRCGVDTAAVAVEAKPLIVFQRSLQDLFVSKRTRMREALGFASNVQFGHSKPHKSRVGVTGYVASESRGNLRQLRERMREDGVEVPGVWPWFAIVRSLGEVLAVGRDFAAITVAESFASYAEFAGGELVVYENHHYPRNNIQERSRALATIAEKVKERIGDKPLVLASPSQEWAQAESAEWSSFVNRANTTVAETNDLLRAVAALSPGGDENMLYAAVDDLGGYVVGACKVIAAIFFVLSVWWVGRTWLSERQLAREIPAFQTTWNGYQKRLKAGVARKADIERIEGGILDPTSQNAAGSALFLAKLAEAFNKVDNAMLLSIRVENRGWHIEWIWVPPYRGADTVLQQQNRNRQDVIKTVLDSLKSAGFVGEVVPDHSFDVSRWRNKDDVIVCVGKMP